MPLTFQNQTNQNSQQFVVVKPTTALLITSMPCERQTALITNSAFAEMRKNNVAGVVHRYDQCKRGERNTFVEMWVMIVGSILWLESIGETLYHSNDIKNNASSGLDIKYQMIIMLLTFACIFPSRANTKRYAEMKLICKDWLRINCNNEDFNRIVVGPSNLNKASVNQEQPKPNLRLFPRLTLINKSIVRSENTPKFK